MTDHRHHPDPVHPVPPDPEASAARRLHVLHVAVPTSGTVADAVLDCLCDQVGRGWSVAVACPSDGPLGFAARQVGARVHWWDPGARPVRGLAGAVHRLRRVVAEAGPDVVHLHGPEAGLPGRVLLRNRLPTVHQPHGWRHTEPRPHGDDPAPGWRRWERWATRWTSELVCGDRAEARRGTALGQPAERTTVIPPGVDLTRWRTQEPGDRRAARAVHHLGRGPVAVCAAHLRPHNGQPDLLVAWSAIRARVPGAQLVLVGDGPDRASLVGQAAGLEGVRLVGERTDVAAWYAAADLVVAPARVPGVPRAVLEAMACARSVVVTGVDGVAETVPAGVGAVVAPGDGPGLAEAVARRLLDPVRCDDEGRRGRTHVERHHDSVALTRELARVYPRLVAARRR